MSPASTAHSRPCEKPKAPVGKDGENQSSSRAASAELRRIIHTLMRHVIRPRLGRIGLDNGFMAMAMLVIVLVIVAMAMHAPFVMIVLGIVMAMVRIVMAMAAIVMVSMVMRVAVIVPPVVVFVVDRVAVI